MPPTAIPRRFATWFFATLAPDGDAGDVTIDGGEIVDHVWVAPNVALERHARGEVELVPPTWITLKHLSGFTSSEDALAMVAEREPPFYLTKMIPDEEFNTVMWHGDAAYDDANPHADGPRHRLVMKPGAWHFQEPT